MKRALSSLHKLLIPLLLILCAFPAHAQDQGLASPEASQMPWGLFFLVLAPLALILVTSFLKISVVLSFLRNALGSPQIPPTSAIVAISVILSAFVMMPVALDVGRAAEPFFPEPISATSIPELDKMQPERTLEMVVAAVVPLQKWLKRHSGARERGLLVQLGEQMYAPEDRAWVGPDSLLVVVPAFVLTELKEAFLIGFVLFMPFLVLDLVIASILMSLNLQSLNPTQVSLPCKLLLFVLMDGWAMLTQGLLLGYL